MIHSGVCSVTFRELVPEQVVELAARAGLVGIEWGGDVHVPSSDLSHAQHVARVTLENGLKVSSYGSYYQVLKSEEEGQPFEWTLETAIALGAPVIRVWAGSIGSAEASESYRRRFAEESRRIAALAADEGLILAYEYHGGTLTDTNESAAALLRAVDHETVCTYWQPRTESPVGHNLDGLESVLPWLAHLHVHHFAGEGEERQQRPLAEGADEWLLYLRKAVEVEGERFALIEFVRGNAHQQFLEDAAALNGWLREISEPAG